MCVCVCVGGGGGVLGVVVVQFLNKNNYFNVFHDFFSSF